MQDLPSRPRRHALLLLLLASTLWLGSGFPPLQAGDAGSPTAPAQASPGTTIYLPLVITPPLEPAQLEVTQAVQQPENPVLLVAGRPTFVRYTLTSETPYSDVQAFLYGARDGTPLPGSPLSALNNPRTLEPAANRAELNDTFNFELPASWTSGTIQLWTSAENGVDYQIYEGPTTFEFAQNDPLAITLVPIAYTCTSGGTGTTTPPAPYDYIDDHALKLFPVPATNLSVHAPAPYSGPCTSTGIPNPAYNSIDGGDWADMLYMITDIRTAEGDLDRYYYGLVSSYCGSSCVTGIGWIGTGAAVGWNGIGGSHSGASQTHAHEVGHNHGRRHAPGCGASGVDASYPYVDGGKSLIGDDENPNYGFDIETMAIKVYTAYYDVMGYCNPDWISDYTYEALFEWGAAQAAVSVRTGAPGDMLLVSGSLRPDGTVELRPAFRLDLPASTPTDGPYTLELLDADGQVLASHPFDMRSAAVDHTGGGPGDEIQGFSLTLPALPGVDHIRVLKAGAPLGSLHPSRAQTETQTAEPRASLDGRVLHLAWEGAAGSAFLVRLSLDGGASWQVVALGSQTADARIDLSHYRGETALVELHLSDGVSSQPIEFGPVHIP